MHPTMTAARLSDSSRNIAPSRPNFKSYSHELNIKSIGECRLQWIAGAFFMHEDNSIRFDIDISQIPAPPQPQVIVVNPTDPDDTAWAMSFIQPKRTLDSQRRLRARHVRVHRGVPLHGGRTLHRGRQGRSGRPQLGVSAVRRNDRGRWSSDRPGRRRERRRPATATTRRARGRAAAPTTARRATRRPRGSHAPSSI